MRTMLACMVAALAVAAAACQAPAPPMAPPEQRDCEQGLAEARQVLGARLVTTLECKHTTLPTGGVYLGYVGTDAAVVFWGPALGDRTPWQYRIAAVHEAGHAWDVKRLTDAQRARYAQIIGRPWNIEDYADTFLMLVETQPPGGGFYGTPTPSAGQRVALCGERIVPCR